MSEYQTIIDFARVKKTSRQTIYNAINRNEIEVVKLYGKTLIRNTRKNNAWNVNTDQQHFKSK